MLFVSFILIVAYSQMRQFVQSSCIYYNQEGFSNEQSQVNSQRMTSHQVDLENDIIIGIGFWISYRPLAFEILDQNPNTPQANDKKSFFVFSLTPQESEIFSLVFYIEISLIDETIQINQVKHQPMDKDTYEGKWIFVYYLINRMEPSIIINYRYLQQEQISSEFYSGQLLLDSQMESTTGGYKDIYLIDMETLYLQTYPGKIQSVILKSYDFFFHNIQEFLTNCIPINCQNKEVTLIQYEYTQINKKEISLQVDSQIYTIQGWVKQDQLVNQQESESLLFKISLNKNNIDNTKIDKSLFIIKYYQSLINLEQNGFSLQLYSYTFPWDTEPFFPIEQDSKYILGYKYMSLLTEWHYFQLQFGTLTNNYQPLFQIYYQVNDQMEYYTWNQNIMLFTVANMYFQIANDNYGLIQFKGQLKDWYLNQLCYPEIVEINFICHYTCKTCKGFSIQDCISCRGEHYRVFSESQNTCKCKLGYIDVPNQAQCQELNQYHKAFELQEKQIAIKKKGYYQTNQYNIICELGYFQYKNKCIECPYPIKNDRVQCADCIIYPNIFSQTLYCTFQFISKDDESVLIYTKLSENEQEIYTISDLIIENQYKIILIKGQGNLGCKNGYFKKNNICTQCSENCEKCKNEDYCDICLTQYKLNSKNKCVECRICAKENILVTAYGTLAFYECEIGTYEYYQLCLPCGSYCSLCTQDSCYKCVDPEKYFITLDSINCISCLIENCKYCFQYYVDQSQNIVNSIDFGSKQIIKDHEIETACALCQINYFYSFLTQKCEFQPHDMTDCQSGIIQIDGTNKCIISNTRTDAVLQSICINIFCKSCILNYSSDIYSFCMRCYDGFYSSFYYGQCFKCPALCLTCVEKEQYQYNQKLSIRPFYQYFINNKNDHLFENYQFKQLEVVCLTCYPYYSLINDRCKQSCSKDCINCDIVNDVNDFRGVFKDLLCSKCKPDVFNFQRSVQQRSQCLQCPEQCSACLSRSSDQITALNPFFDKNSSFLKYTFICFLTDHNNQVKIKPQYYVPNKCSNSQYCDNKIQISQLVYCNRNAFNQAEQSEINKQTFQLFYSIIYNRVLNKLESSEMLEYMNQHQITEINYNLELIDFQDFDMCIILDDGSSIQNTWKKYVFSLKQINILFYKSQKNKDEKLPLQLRDFFQKL